MQAQNELNLLPFQSEFFLSAKRFPAFVGAIGTGKTFVLLLKLWAACEQYPGLRALLVRKEYTDLRDSSIADFQRYFDVSINKNEKKYQFANGSEILFRHGGEINVLKNLNLGIIGIEQAEEFEDASVFDFLRDRLRQQVAGLGKRQLCIIANANGHNWIWERWLNNPPSDEYHIITATTFDNPYLPDDFIEDLRQMENEAPQHYRRYVLNSFDEFDAPDLLFLYDDLRKGQDIPNLSSNYRVMALDPAWAEDEFAVAVVDRKGGMYYDVRYVDGWKHTDLMVSIGRVLELCEQFDPNLIVVDEVGVGAGVLSRLRELKRQVLGFNSHKTDGMRQKDRYTDMRSEAYHLAKEQIHRVKIPIDDTLLVSQLQSIRFGYKSDGRRYIISKPELMRLARREGKRIKSPDRADAVIMAFYYCYHQGGKAEDIFNEFTNDDFSVIIGSERLLKH